MHLASQKSNQNGYIYFLKQLLSYLHFQLTFEHEWTEEMTKFVYFFLLECA